MNSFQSLPDGHDKSLTYSSAVYKNEKDDLEIAQRNKFQELINLMNIKDGNKVLEIPMVGEDLLNF